MNPGSQCPSCLKARPRPRLGRLLLSRRRHALYPKRVLEQDPPPPLPLAIAVGVVLKEHGPSGIGAQLRVFNRVRPVEREVGDHGVAREDVRAENAADGGVDLAVGSVAGRVLEVLFFNAVLERLLCPVVELEGVDWCEDEDVRLRFDLSLKRVLSMPGPWGGR